MQGRFREDLFYRLHVFPISVPPLAERSEDIPELVRHFLARFAAEEGKRVTAISSEALALLCAYRWPGNVRQLENAVFRAVVLAEGSEIGMAEFPQITQAVQGASALPPALIANMPNLESPNLDAPSLESPSLESPSLESSNLESPNLAADSLAGALYAKLALLDATGDIRPLEEIEGEVIRFAIAHYRGQMSEVARRLQIGRSTLYRKLDSLGLATLSENGPPEPVVNG
jgi:DNA-binding NtrC family response regulator